MNTKMRLLQMAKAKSPGSKKGVTINTSKSITKMWTRGSWPTWRASSNSNTRGFSSKSQKRSSYRCGAQSDEVEKWTDLDLIRSCESKTGLRLPWEVSARHWPRFRADECSLERWRSVHQAEKFSPIVPKDSDLGHQNQEWIEGDRWHESVDDSESWAPHGVFNRSGDWWVESSSRH